MDKKTDTFNDDRELVRYEFFEILVRIAKFKYLDSGELDESQIARALHRLFNEYLLPVLNLKKLPEWQPFRKYYLWNNAVSDLLKANMQHIRLVYAHILEMNLEGLPRKHNVPKCTSPHMISIDQVLYFFG